MISRIKLFIKEKIASHVHYFNGRLYKFKVDNVGNVVLEPAESTKVKLLIVSPDFVLSELQSYPIVNKKELKGLLALKKMPSDHYMINSITKKGAEVTHYRFQAGVPEAWFMLPELLMLDKFVGEDSILTVEHKKDSHYFYLTKLAKRLYYAPKVGLINSVERFQVAIGTSAPNERSLSWSNKANAILPCVNLELVKWLILFTPKQKAFNLKALLQNGLLPISLVLVVYMSVVSGMLLFQEHSLKQQLSQQSGTIKNTFALQSELNEQVALYGSLKSFVEQRYSIDNLWEVMAPFFATLDVDSINLNGKRFTFRAEAKSATQTLEKFSALAFVSDAKFDTPISKSRTGERFTISFVLREGNNEEVQVP
ncbi:hypothetical protein [Pseudoalteromonas sp. MMG005]|uniref:hypothetical protein n=1 Tax=Pseudoalteromonas sp. MMG005 TaxID=2822682 RepID=UPI001B39F95E|nr:hypothetical protein [Pseudoalteromonas sp. MMG005]MBQ4844348.1 hypothetical protein [Pseudoalteromonas sp. MMG005]